MRKYIASLIVFCVLMLASCSPQSKWVLLHPSNNPPALAQSGFAYDINSSEGVVFGGIFKDKWSDETWLWNGSDWRKVDLADKPPAREKVAMAYDEARDRVVIFGGRMDKTLFDDTWEWDGRIWELVEPAHKPPARCCHAMAYDSVQKKILLYGGWDPITGKFFNDTWEWDGIDWTELSSGNVPPAAGHMLVNFSSENKVVAVPSTRFANTWEWNGSQWSEIISLPTPSRSDSRSAYDSDFNRIVFFGGIENRDTYLNGTWMCNTFLKGTRACGSSRTFLNDTWVFDGHVWNLLNVSSPPPARFAHIMFYDKKRHSIILFGGIGTESLLGDTWELALPQDLSEMIIDKTPMP